MHDTLLLEDNILIKFIQSRPRIRRQNQKSNEKIEQQNNTAAAM